MRAPPPPFVVPDSTRHVRRDDGIRTSIGRLSDVDSTWPSNPDAALTTFVTEFQHRHFELDETVCEQGFDMWAEAAAECLPILMRGTDRCNGIEPLGYRPGFALMWALIQNVFFGDERAALIAEVAEAFGDKLAERLGHTNPPDHEVLRYRLARTPYVGLYRFSAGRLATPATRLS